MNDTSHLGAPPSPCICPTAEAVAPRQPRPEVGQSGTAAPRQDQDQQTRSGWNRLEGPSERSDTGGGGEWGHFSWPTALGLEMLYGCFLECTAICQEGT